MTFIDTELPMALVFIVFAFWMSMVTKPNNTMICSLNRRELLIIICFVLLIVVACITTYKYTIAYCIS